MAGIIRAKPQLTSHNADMHRDDEVERAATAYAMNYERQEGHGPENQSPLKLPYDIRSIQNDGYSRYIEVKGRAGVGGVELSEREWLTAENLGADHGCMWCRMRRPGRCRRLFMTRRIHYLR